MKGNLHGVFFTGPSLVTHGGLGVVVILGIVGCSGYSVAGVSVLELDFSVASSQAVLAALQQEFLSVNLAPQ